MNIEEAKALAQNIASPLAKTLHANSMVSVGSILYLSKKGIIDLDDYLDYMDKLKEELLQSPNYDDDTKQSIAMEFDSYFRHLKP